MGVAMADHVSSPVHSTFTVERTFTQPAARVFRLLSLPERKRRWLLEDDGTEIGRFEMDFRVGGREIGEYTIQKGSPVDGMPFVNDGVFFEIVPDQRVVMATSMAIGGRRISVALITFELAPRGTGTHLTITHQAVFLQGADGPRMREQGWIHLMDRLAAALDAEAGS